MDECPEMICAPPDLFGYNVESNEPLLIDYPDEEIPLLLEDGSTILL